MDQWLLLLLHLKKKKANLAEVLLACWLNTHNVSVGWMGRVWHIKRRGDSGKECKKSSRQEGRYYVYSQFGARAQINAFTNIIENALRTPIT